MKTEKDMKIEFEKSIIGKELVDAARIGGEHDIYLRVVLLGGRKCSIADDVILNRANVRMDNGVVSGVDSWG